MAAAHSSSASGVLAILTATSLLFVGMSATHLVSSVELLKARQAIAMLQAGRVPSPEAIERVFDATALSLKWRDLASSRFARARASLSLTRLAAVETDWREALYEEAVQELRRGLRRSPVVPDAWLTLANALAAAGKSDAAVEALNLSLYTGPVGRELVVPRAVLAIAIWPAADEMARNVMIREIAAALPVDAERLAREARVRGTEKEISDALQPLPNARGSFLRALRSENDPNRIRTR